MCYISRNIHVFQSALLSHSYKDVGYIGNAHREFFKFYTLTKLYYVDRIKEYEMSAV